MMRFLRWLLTIPFFAILLVFVLHNKAPVSLDFWPFDLQADLPVSALAVGLFVLGLAIGSLLMGFSVLRAGLEACALRKQVAKLTAQLEEKDPIRSESALLCKNKSSLTRWIHQERKP